MSQVVPKVARFELRYTIPDNTIENVFHVKCDAASWSQTVMDDCEAAFVSWFTTTGSQQMSDELHLIGIQATDLTSLSGIRKLYPIEPGLAGNQNGELLPANVTFALKASISTRGRGTSGRIFWPTVVATQVTFEQMNKANADLLVTALNTLISDIAGVDGVTGLVVPHFVVGGVRPPTVDASNILSYGYTDLWLDSQRLRLPAHKKAKKRASPTI